MSRWVSVRQHIAEITEQGLSVLMPEHLREQHQPDPQRLSQGFQCVCMCGTPCVSYTEHLREVVEHNEWWENSIAEHGHPAEAFIRAGINPWTGEQP